MPAPKELQDLVERFGQHIDDYKNGRYNETQVRRDFIDPFFKLLGWDVSNEGGVAEAYRDVIHEDAIKIGGSTKAPDYCFRIGGTRKFFVEAKKPSVDIKGEVAPAYQIRRYAWSAKLPLSILTDFEEFAVYDTRIRPSPVDRASTARIQYWTFKDYAAKWDEIVSIFSKEAVLKGSFDKYAASTKSKKGTAEVDTAFLDEIETWRELLAKSIALRNEELSQQALNFAVQQTIDRIIFLRICEDRGIEPYGQLQALVNGSNIYKRLTEIFHKADQRYNSGLFHFRDEKDRSESPDKLTLKLDIDDKPLKEIFHHLYYPDSPYEFSVLGADILGSVYERFLGKVIRLTEGHHAKIEEKPEVKKAGGVFYTPTYIVQYIVKHTVGKLLEGKTPKEAEKLRILDPACGSGSFLIGAYQYLLDWHREWYVNDGAEKHAKGKHPKLWQGRGGEWRLTTSERKRILTNNIYGVDIDSQAVEVTKLSLLLKVLEGESDQTMQTLMFHDRVLPDLGRNIKCGNSLIGTEFYQTQLIPLDDAERQRINAFDWSTEFPQVFSPSPGGRGQDESGFDVVIGNPPYIRIQVMKEWAPQEVLFYKTQYLSASKGNYDIYVVFVERGLNLLNKSGRLGFILPHKFFNAQYGEPLRSLISQGKHLAEVVHFGDQQVFAGATTYTCLLFLDKAGLMSCRVSKVDDINCWRDEGKANTGDLAVSAITNAEWNFAVGSGGNLYTRLAKLPLKLGDIANIFVGLQTSADTVFLFKDSVKSSASTTTVFSKELDKQVELDSTLLKRVIRSGEVGRFWAKPSALALFPYARTGSKLSLIPEGELKRDYPKTWAYLLSNKKLLSEREHGKFQDTGWWQLYPKNLDVWEQPKLMLPYMVTRLSAFYDEENSYFVNVTTGGFGITLKSGDISAKYLTGLLNSRLLDWFLKQVSTTFHGGYFAANKQFLVQIPIHPIDLKNVNDRTHHDRMVSLVETMLALHKQLAVDSTPHEQESLKRQINDTDRQIDKLVYELYDLTGEEIKIVEGEV